MRGLSAIVLLPLCTCMVQTSGFSAADREAVIQVLESQREAWNRGDLDGYMAGYERSDELLFTSGARVRRGWEATRRKYAATYGGAPESMGHLDFEVLDLRGVGNGAAVMLGTWRLTETTEAGSGIFSLVFARGPEGWQVIHDHTSADPS